MTTPWGDLATYRKRQHQKFEAYLTKGVQVNPKAYCCDDNTINDEKPPVALLTVTPNPIYAGESATLSLNGSWDPDGAGIDTYEIWDGKDPPGYYLNPAGNDEIVAYPVAGRYECIGVVTDGSGLKGQASVWLEVLGAENPPEPPGGWRKKVYVATKVNGIYYTEDFSGPGGADPTWEQVNTDLGVLTTQCIVGDPWNPSYRQYTRTGYDASGEPKIYRRENGDPWDVILDWTIVFNTPGVVAEGMFRTYRRMIGPVGNINAQGHLYVLVRYYDDTGKNRLYFFKSTNYGDDWIATLIIGPVAAVSLEPQALRVGALQGASPHGAGQVIYALFRTGAVNDVWGVRVSTNQGGAGSWGATINLLHCGTVLYVGDLRRSPADQDVIYWAAWGQAPTEYRLRKSPDRGGSWSDIWACAAAPTMVRGPGTNIWNPSQGLMPAGDAGLHWTENDWVDYTTYPKADNFPVDRVSRVMDAPELLYGSQANNPGGGDMQHVIAVSDDRGQNWEGKAGDDPALPSATSIPNDCGGVAMILQIWTEE